MFERKQLQQKDDLAVVFLQHDNIGTSTMMHLGHDYYLYMYYRECGDNLAH